MLNINESLRHETAQQSDKSAILSSPSSSFREAMRHALEGPQREISSLYLYDDNGSEIFDAICDLPEYYPTRVEISILERHGSDIAELIGPKAEIIEFGAGSPRKMRTFLPHLRQPVRYVPIDISGPHLQAEVNALKKEQPWLNIEPLVADITQPMHLPKAPGTEKRVGLYLGSSIGNFDAHGATALLKRAAQTLQGGALLVGIDLVKDPRILHNAYNDADGITASFNLNLLARANRELKTDFELKQFVHYAPYNPSQQRVEMHLVSAVRQTVHLNGQAFELREGDAIHTENSHKFTLSGFQALARAAGLRAGPVWTDPLRWFALQWLECDPVASLIG